MSFNVMIVDDSAVMRNVIQRVLNLSGFDIGQIYQAGNGKDALEVMDKNWIDVILSDLNMPVMNGWEMLGEMKKNATTADIPVIIISTESRPERVEELQNKGAAGYIAKPFRPEDIKNVISKALGVSTDGENAGDSEECDF
jgi:two-component system, chemotaxis family, chemotaxis protein CheY